MSRQTWAGLGLSGQCTLRWLVNIGGHPYASDLPNLRGFARDGLAVVDEAGRWSVTDEGRAVYATRLNPTAVAS